MKGLPTNSGRRLNREWGVNAQHALYHKDGDWYQLLERFPGALFDPNGYVVFATEKEYKLCGYLERTTKLHVPGGISRIPGYKAKPVGK